MDNLQQTVERHELSKFLPMRKYRAAFSSSGH